MARRVSSAPQRNIGQFVAAGRIEHGQLATGVGIHPLAGNQVPGAQQFWFCSFMGLKIL